MSVFEIEKEVEKVRFILAKNGIDHVVRARVGLNLDVSGSMIELYKQGIVQKVVERILPLGLACDDNGEIDVWGFSNRAALACVATRENYQNIVDQEMMDGDLDDILWEGTQYAPVIHANLNYYQRPSSPVRHFFRKLFGHTAHEEEALPVINYFLTDGENTDIEATQKLFEHIRDSEAQIYYMLIGVGAAQFQFIRQAAQRFPNVGFIAVESLQSFINDENIYEQLLPNELCTWLKHEHDDDHHD